MNQPAPRGVGGGASRGGGTAPATVRAQAERAREVLGGRGRRGEGVRGRSGSLGSGGVCDRDPWLDTSLVRSAVGAGRRPAGSFVGEAYRLLAASSWLEARLGRQSARVTGLERAQT
jgi:hypothetical protein